MPDPGMRLATHRRAITWTDWLQKPCPPRGVTQRCVCPFATGNGCAYFAQANGECCDGCQTFDLNATECYCSCANCLDGCDKVPAPLTADVLAKATPGHPSPEPNAKIAKIVHVPTEAFNGLKRPKHHFLSHLALDVWRYGPPRGYWCFGFESFNKVIKAGSARTNWKNETVGIMRYWSMKSACSMCGA